MTTDLTHAERVEALLSNPDRYGELVEAYEDGTKFYEKTRSKAPRVTHDFEDYLRFHEIFIDYGPSEYIYWSLERNTDRSIKNMLTGGSDAGETFRIYTLEQASQRVDSYRELGVQNTSLRGVVTTLLEELYEEKNTNKFIYHVLSTLLDRVPDSEPEVVELVARARLIAGVDTVHREQRILEELRQYLDETINPRPRDGRPADELLDEANQRSYSDPERVNLHRAALHKDPSIELLSEYLYLSGRDIVERYRHREMEDPTVGELQLCRRQFAIIQEFSVEHGAEDIAYIQSYYYLTKALYESGREWRSKQDPQKTEGSNFTKAAQEYLRAAAAIKEWNSERYIKYLNKSFRHAANATESWRGKVELHDCAVVALTEAGRQIDDDDIAEIIDDSKQLQEFWGQLADAYTQLEQGHPDGAHESAIAAEKQLHEIDIRSSSRSLQRVLALSEGLVLEKNEDYDSAVSRYSELDPSDEKVEARENIAQIKSYLQDDKEEAALECALSHCGDDSLITNALRAVSGSEISSRQSHGTFPNDMLIRDTESVEWQLRSILSLFVGTDTFRDFFRNHVRLGLMRI